MHDKGGRLQERGKCFIYFDAQLQELGRLTNTQEEGNAGIPGITELFEN